jgi:hypothetical protein
MRFQQRRESGWRILSFANGGWEKVSGDEAPLLHPERAIFLGFIVCETEEFYFSARVEPHGAFVHRPTIEIGKNVDLGVECWVR